MSKSRGIWPGLHRPLYSIMLIIIIKYPPCPVLKLRHSTLTIIALLLPHDSRHCSSFFSSISDFLSCPTSRLPRQLSPITTLRLLPPRCATLHLDPHQYASKLLHTPPSTQMATLAQIDSQYGQDFMRDGSKDFGKLTHLRLTTFTAGFFVSTTRLSGSPDYAISLFESACS